MAVRRLVRQELIAGSCLVPAGTRGLNVAPQPADDPSMTMPPLSALPSVPPPTGPPPGEKAARRPSVEHIILGVVLAVVVLGAAGWFLLKPGSSTSTAARSPVSPAAATVRPTATTVAPAAKAVRTAVPKPAKGHALTKVAYVKAGNAVCAALTKDIAKLGRFPDGKAGGPYVTKVVRLIQGAQTRFGKLRAPAKDAGTLQKIRTTVAHQVALDKQLATALGHGDQQQITSLARPLDITLARLTAEYRAYGLVACAA